ncbi:Phage terminase, endonuclease small subunit M [Escherichia coli]|nr:Phage terminase, endonuclease small subunit M [Escherichia coli]
MPTRIYPPLSNHWTHFGKLSPTRTCRTKWRAKLCKACAFARRGPDRCRQHGLITEAAARSDAPEPERRCETRDCNPSRALKKADSADASEDASAQQAQDESSKSKKTTRKPATRKTTATQKAKRGLTTDPVSGRRARCSGFDSVTVYTAHPPPDFFQE